MDTNEQKKSSSKGLIGGIIAVLVVAGGIFMISKNNSTGSQEAAVATIPTDTTTATTPTTSTSTTPADTKNKYADGTYTSDGSYISPAGAESITVTLVIKNDTVTDATVVSHATISNSVRFQGQFISGFKQYVVGKSVDSINLTKVSGSSLTPKGFNDALAKIKTQAMPQMEG